MFDGATSRLFARSVPHDSTDETWLRIRVLLPEQLQGDVLVGLQFAPDASEVWFRGPAPSARGGFWNAESGQQLLVRPVGDVLIAETGGPGAGEIVRDGGLAEGTTGSNLTLTEPLVRQP